VIGKTGDARRSMVAWLLLALAAVMLDIEGAAAPPNAAESIAEMVSNCSSDGGEAVVATGVADDEIAAGSEMMPIPSKGALGIFCRASMSLWIWFLCDLPSWRAWNLNAAANVGWERVKRRCRIVKVEADAFQRVILAISTSVWILIVPAMGRYMNWEGMENSKQVYQ
jgi:hypothetical protein